MFCGLFVVELVGEGPRDLFPFRFSRVSLITIFRDALSLEVILIDDNVKLLMAFTSLELFYISATEF